ncbi:MAG TPA: monovalent cation/H(+) antiporter subunit G [Streptomyces sp.]|nr:monovalent cation/H(+) antiporter subunit G [Streptomyces sp.]
MRTLLDIVSAFFLLTGAVFCLLGAIGLVRFPDPITRLHASAKAQVLGLVLVLVGAALRAPAEYVGLLLLIAVFQFVTVPVLSQIVGRVAYRTGMVDRRSLTVDELADRLASLGVELTPDAAPDTGDAGATEDGREPER